MTKVYCDCCGCQIGANGDACGTLNNIRNIRLKVGDAAVAVNIVLPGFRIIGDNTCPLEVCKNCADKIMYYLHQVKRQMEKTRQ